MEKIWNHHRMLKITYLPLYLIKATAAFLRLISWQLLFHNKYTMTSWCTNNTEPVKDDTNATSSYLLTFAKLLSVIEMQNINFVRTIVPKLPAMNNFVTTIFRLHQTSYLKFQYCSCRQVNSNNDKTLNKGRCGWWVFWEFLVKVILYPFKCLKRDLTDHVHSTWWGSTHKRMQQVIMSAMLYWF